MHESSLALPVSLRLGKTLSKALRILAGLSAHWGSGSLVTAEELALREDLPRPWVARLLGHLTQCGIVRSHRGPGGGYVLAREPESIALWDVVEAFRKSGLCQSEFDDSWVLSKGLQETIEHTNSIFQSYLQRTTLDVFVANEWASRAA